MAVVGRLLLIMAGVTAANKRIKFILTPGDLTAISKPFHIL